MICNPLGSIAFLAGFLFLGGFAFSEAPETFAGGLVRTGRCEVRESNEDTQSAFPTLCLRAQSGVYFLAKTDKPEHRGSALRSEGYTGLYPVSWLSAHLKASLQRRPPMGAEKEWAVDRTDRQVDELYLNLGNPALDKLRIAGGKIPTSFGINHRVLPHYYSEVISTKRYFSAPNRGIVLAFNTQVSAVHELSLHQKWLAGRLTDDKQVAWRSSFDVAALEGLRIVLSGTASEDGDRKISLGMINVNQREERISLEWIRDFDRPEITADFQQQFHFVYEAPFRSGLRWLFDFESERDVHRIGTVGFDAKLPDYGLLRLSGSYANSWNDVDNSYFALMSGFELHL